MNKKDGNDPQKHTADQPDDNTSHTTSVPYEQQKIVTETSKNKSKGKGNDGWPNRVQAIFTALIFIVTTAYVIVAYFQWKTMSSQLGVMESSSTTTEKSMKNTLTEMKRQSTAMEVQAKTTKEATQETKKAIQLTEAADIEGDQITCSPESPVLSRNSSIFYILKNSGKTRAEQVRMIYVLGFPDLPLRFYSPPQKKTGTIAAGQKIRTMPLKFDDGVSESIWTDINEGRIQLHFWGHVSYFDVFGNHHCHVWDGAYVPKTKCDFEVIKEYNAKECPKDNTYQY
jgi:hypothetical protein